MAIPSRHERRLAELEGANSANRVVLYFDDHSTRSIEIRRKTERRLWSDVGRLAYWILYPENFTTEKLAKQRARVDVPPGAFDHEDKVTGRPISRFDHFFPLLMQAVKVSGAGNMFVMAWTRLVHIRECQRRGYRFACTREALASDPFYACLHRYDFTGYFGNFKGDLSKQLKVVQKSSGGAPERCTAQSVETK